MKKRIWILGAVLVLFIEGIVLSPFYSFYQIASGITENDAKKLSYYVEFPELRENLKDQLNRKIENKFAEKSAGDESRFSAVAYKFIKRFSARLVDIYVTPEGLGNLMGIGADKTQRPDTEEESKPSGKKKSAVLRLTSKEKFKLLRNARFSFVSTHTFIVSIPARNNKIIQLVLNRNRFLWKLTNIVLPSNSNVAGLPDM